MDHRIDEVIDFWFGDESPAFVRRWFMKDPAFDSEIRQRFGALHDEAAAGGLDEWRSTPRGELALIVVLDQFSRNMYRDDPRAFATDERALSISRELWNSGRIRQLGKLQRAIATMPFQHSEDRATQNESVAHFEQLVADFGTTDEMLVQNLDYAKQHAAIIERFGRYPHRNKVLGRESTAEEDAFLKQPGSSF